MDYYQYDHLVNESPLRKALAKKKNRELRKFLISIISFLLLFTVAYMIIVYARYGESPDISDVAYALLILVLLIVAIRLPYTRFMPFFIILLDYYFLFLSLRTADPHHTEIPLLVIIPIVSYLAFPMKHAIFTNWIYMLAAYFLFSPWNAVLNFRSQDPVYTLILFASYILVSIISFYTATVYKDHIETLLQDFFFDRLNGVPNEELLRLKVEAEPKGLACLMRIVNIDDFCKANEKIYVQKLIAELVKSLMLSEEFPGLEIFKKKNNDLILLCESVKKDEWDRSLKNFMDRFSVMSINFNDQTVYLKISCGATPVEKDMVSILRKTEAALEMALRNNTPYHFLENYPNPKDRQIESPFQTLMKCIKNDTIVLHFQPIVDPITTEVAKAEALIRFYSSDGTMLSQGALLEAAYESGMNGYLTGLIIEKAGHWSKENNIPVSVNISTYDLQFKPVVDSISKTNHALKNLGLNLTIELLESTNCSKKHLNLLREMQQEGIEIAIDDFGSGFANFERILTFNADIIKFDGSLIKELPTSKVARHLVSSMCQLAHMKNIRTIAEHIEDESILRHARAFPIDLMQGYYYGKPSPKILQKA